jgi:DNA-binding XRE family transcriptional regulator
MRIHLWAARMHACMTQAEVGALIGKTQGHYGKIERGQLDLRASEALVLCTHFNLTIQQLMERKD